MNKTYLFAPILLFSAVLSAQQPTKQDNIRKLIDITTKGQLGDSVTAMMLKGFKQQYSKADSAFWKSVEPEINMNGLTEQLILIYEKYYTEKDIKELLAFYEQPIGKKMIAVLPKIMNESMGVGREWGMQLDKMIRDKLKAAGYEY